MKYRYQTSGTCSREICFEIVDGRLANVQFVGGCHGNTQGLCALLEGMDAADAMRRLQGIKCGTKGTSCPDQLARAIAEAEKQ